MNQGVCYIAYGRNALQSYLESRKSLLKYNDLDISVCSDNSPHIQDMPIRYTNVQRSRWAKVNLDLWSPYDYTLYIDADTKVNGSIMSGFELLGEGWDVCISASSNQGARLLWHCSSQDKEATFEMCGSRDVLQYQAGVLFFRKSDAVKKLFENWRREWLKFKEQDQGAFIRALIQSPVSIMLLGTGWNSINGGLITHLFGKAR
jgi:hypothetical protein